MFAATDPDPDEDTLDPYLLVCRQIDELIEQYEDSDEEDEDEDG